MSKSYAAFIERIAANVKARLANKTQGEPGAGKHHKWRIELFEKQHGRCHWCGNRMESERGGDGYASFEHLLPRSLGGKFTKDNIVLVHVRCNR